MHMSDGLVNAPTSVVFGALAIAAVALCAWKARAELDERTVPLAGLVAVCAGSDVMHPLGALVRVWAPSRASSA